MKLRRHQPHQAHPGRTGTLTPTTAGNRRARRAAASKHRKASPGGTCSPDAGPKALIHPKSGDILRTSLPGHPRACAACSRDRIVFVLGDHPTRGVFALCVECARKPSVLERVDYWTGAEGLDRREELAREEIARRLREWSAE